MASSAAVLHITPGRLAGPFVHMCMRAAVATSYITSRLRTSIASRPRTFLLQGFQRVADNLPDISLDNPAARERFDAAVKAARAGEPAGAAAVPRLQSLWQLLLLLPRSSCSCSARILPNCTRLHRRVRGGGEEGCTVALSGSQRAVAIHACCCLPAHWLHSPLQAAGWRKASPAPLPRPVSASNWLSSRLRLGCTAARVTAACAPPSPTLHSSHAPSSMELAARPGCRRLPPALLTLSHTGPQLPFCLDFSVLQAPPARQVQSSMARLTRPSTPTSRQAANASHCICPSHWIQVKGLGPAPAHLQIEAAGSSLQGVHSTACLRPPALPSTMLPHQ